MQVSYKVRPVALASSDALRGATRGSKRSQGKDQAVY